jgi:hypothetical protein
MDDVKRKYLVIFQKDRNPTNEEIIDLLNIFSAGNLTEQIPGIFRSEMTEDQYQKVMKLGIWDISPEGIFKLS